MCICVLVTQNHLFCKTNTKKMVAKVNNLCTEEKPSFVYLRIRVSGQRNHSLWRPKINNKTQQPTKSMQAQQKRERRQGDLMGGGLWGKGSFWG
jgi:hypothetical protein